MADTPGRSEAFVCPEVTLCSWREDGIQSLPNQLRKMKMNGLRKLERRTRRKKERKKETEFLAVIQAYEAMF